MKRRTVLGGLLAGLLSAGLTGVTGQKAGWKALAGETGDAVLRMGLRHDLKHPLIQKVIEPWSESLMRRSGGRLRIRLFAAGELCLDNDILNALLVDTMSMGVISPSLVVPPLLVTSFFDSPLLFPNAQTGSLVMWDMLQDNAALQEEYRFVHVLWAWIATPMLLHTVAKPVRRVEDAVGLKFITWSGIEADVVKSIGAISLHALAGDTSSLLQRGLADGVVCPFLPVQSFNLEQYLRHTTEVPLTGVSFIMAMNKEVWNGLPLDLQTLLTQAAGRRMSSLCGAFLDKEAAKVKESLRVNGHDFIQPSLAEMEHWKVITAPMRAEAEKKLELLHVPFAQGIGEAVERTRSKVLSEL